MRPRLLGPLLLTLLLALGVLVLLRLQLLLRTRDGIPVDSFTLETLTLLEGLVVTHPVDPSRVVLTRRGRLMANEISMRFA